MVVREEQRRGVGGDGRAKHIARMRHQRVERAAGERFDADQPPLGVHEHNMKMLDLEQPVVFAQEAGQLLRCVEHRRLMAQFVGQALGQAERTFQRDRLVAADAFHAQFLDGRLGQGVERAKLVEQRLGDIDCRQALRAGAQQNGDQFTVLERLRALGQKTFARLFAVGQILDARRLGHAVYCCAALRFRRRSRLGLLLVGFSTLA